MKTNDKPAALLALEDGRVFDCASFTGPGEASGEIVFNTGMTGYQEILTDPSYNGQMVVMTYPLIGTYGVNPEDMESDGIRAEALIVKEYQADPSNHRAGEALADFLRRHGKMGIEGLDTRALTRHIRTAGAMRAFVSTANLDPRFCVQKAGAIRPMVGCDLTRAASTIEPYRWVNGEKVFFSSPQVCFRKGVWAAQGRKPSVTAIDYGAKHNILRCLEASGFEVIVVPAATNAADIMAMAPDAVFLSNGPGDPEMAHRTYIEPVTADTVAAIIAKERPDALLPTLGGQTGLNTAVELHRMGVLEAHGVELIGANLEAIRKAEDRDLFRRAMTDIGLAMAPSDIATDMENARAAADRIGYPVIIRPAFTLGGTGGSNVQFAVNPRDGRMLVVEMNPQVSRSSALASKATGFPIAKIAALLAVGYTLDELPNDITGRTVASFEPALDYCVVKIPRFAFEKFPDCEDILTTSMQSVGEAMAIGRTFKEALQKAMRSLETGRHPIMDDPPSETLIARKLAQPNSQRIFYLRHALSAGWSEQRLFELTGIDPWFLNQMGHLAHLERELASTRGPLPAALMRKAKAWGFADEQIARLTGVTEEVVGKHRRGLEIFTAYKQVDTCAAEFEAATPYYYSTYETECEARAVNGAKVMIIGGGPNRIGQGIEFDYCCVHAAFALAEEGVQSIMVNSNPETVSTDYDISDRLYFEPLTLGDVLHIVETEKPMGVIVQFGGQTPLNLALPLHRAGVTILGTHPQDIARAEDRSFFRALLQQLGLHQPASEAVLTVREAAVAAAAIGFPVLVRPSYVLGGRAMKIVFDPSELETIVRLALEASPGHPVLIDKFLENAVEVDVDAVSDGANTCIAGLMEHIEAAGIHSGDSACVLPPRTLGDKVIEEIRAATRAMAAELRVVGLMNVQYAVHNDKLFVLEVNPRASRTVPFVSKATGVALAKVAAKAMLGRSLMEVTNAN